MTKDSNAIFRPFRIEDSVSLARNMNNPKIWDRVRDFLPKPYTEHDALSFINMSLAQVPMVNFAIDVDGQAIGGIGVTPQRDVQRLSAEIGYWLGEEYWGRGIVSGVLRDVTEYIFASTELIHIFAGVFSNNPASIRVLEKAGYAHVGIMHRAAIKNGQILDMNYYEKVK